MKRIKEDTIIAFVQVGFAAALLPSIWSSHKPALATSVLTALGLWIIAGAYLRVDWFWAMLTTASAATLWTILVLQVI